MYGYDQFTSDGTIGFGLLEYSKDQKKIEKDTDFMAMIQKFDP